MEGFFHLFQIMNNNFIYANKELDENRAERDGNTNVFLRFTDPYDIHENETQRKGKSH